MSQPTLTLRQTIRAAPTWTRIYLPAGGLDGLVEALWLFTLGWEASRAGAASGLVLAAGALPAVAFVLWGGSLADRFGAHRVATWTMAARVVVMVAWAAVIIAEAKPAYVAAAVAFAVGTIGGIHDPAVSALPRLLVPQPGLEASTNAQRVLVRLVQTLGPLLGGFISAWLGMGIVVITAAAIGLIALAGFAFLRRIPHHAEGEPAATDGNETGWQSALSGFRWIASHPAIRRTVPVQGVINLTSAAILMAALPRQARIYGWGPDVYGLAVGAFGLGMLVGSLAAFVIRPRAPRRKVGFAVSCAAAASAMVALTGTATSTVVAVTAAGLMGLTLGPVGAILTGWTVASTAATSPTMYARVYAVLLLVTVAAEPVGYLIFALLATVTSVAITSLVFAALGIGVCVVALCSRAVRVVQTT